MFDGCVLGVDPGVAAVGLAAVTGQGGRPRILWAETLRTPSDLADGSRLRTIYAGVRDAIAAQRPSVLAIERVMWGRNVGSAMAVARASGVILLAAADSGIPIEEYAPLEIKMAATGSGNAAKEAVRRALAKVHQLSDVPSQPDAADAVAVALCHMLQSRLRAAAGGVLAR